VFYIFTAVYRDIEQVYRLNMIDISLSPFNFLTFFVLKTEADVTLMLYLK